MLPFPDSLEQEDLTLEDFLEEADTQRPALLAGEEGENPDPHIFRGVD
ncbi:hypothetical protein [Streptomyces sp. KR55]